MQIDSIVPLSGAFGCGVSCCVFETLGNLCPDVSGELRISEAIQGLAGTAPAALILGANSLGDGRAVSGRRTLQRGGARNRADRESTQLTERQCRSLITASGVAWAAGTPFNRFVTLAWGKSGLGPMQGRAATSSWVALARAWIGAHSYAPPWAWVQEFGPKFGAHSHLLIHLPPELAAIKGQRFARWARKVVADLGGSYQTGTVDTRSIHCSHCADIAPDAYRAALLAKVHYMLKAAPAALEGQLGMIGQGPKPWGQHSLVYGKRLAIWQGWQKAGGVDSFRVDLLGERGDR